MPFASPDAKREYDRARYAANAAAIEAQKIAYYEANRERMLAKSRAYYVENREACLQYDAKYSAENADIKRAARKRWRDSNQDQIRVLAQARRAAMDRRTVGWDQELTDLVAVEAADLAARREEITGFPWHVDHVVPLRGKNVSGLHVWNNLDVIPAEINVKKNNKFHVA